MFAEAVPVSSMYIFLHKVHVYAIDSIWGGACKAMSDFNLSLGSCYFSYFVRIANERTKVALSLRAHLSLLNENREGCEKKFYPFRCHFGAI